MEWPPSKALLLAFTPLLLLLAAAPKVYTIYQRKQIRKESVVTVGTVSDFELVKIRYWQFYRAHIRFSVDGESFVGKSRVVRTLSDGQLRRVRGKKLPVVYEKYNPANHVVLATEEQFGHFELIFPDSLRWARQYFY